MRTSGLEMNSRELLAFLCEDPASEAVPIISAWLTNSKRFHAFAIQNRTKIRKKLRTATTSESLRSVLLELEVAHQLLGDRRCAVEYEKYGQGGVRSPDLTLVFRENTVINIEATLLKDVGAETGEREDKLISTICHKLGQMMPENPNVLVLAVECGSLTVEHVSSAMKGLKNRVEQRDEKVLAKFDFTDPAGFFKQFQWLSAIIVWRGCRTEREECRWLNPQARRPLPGAVATLFTA